MRCLNAMPPPPESVPKDVARGRAPSGPIRFGKAGNVDIAASPLNGLVSNWLRFYSGSSLGTELMQVNKKVSEAFVFA